jgi:hypothetical protein
LIRRSACSSTLPPPNVATAATMWYPPFSLNAAVVAEMLEKDMASA